MHAWMLLIGAALVVWLGLVHQGLLPTPAGIAGVADAPGRALTDASGPLLAVAVGVAGGVLLAVASGLSWWGRLLADVRLSRLRWVPALGLVGLAASWFGSVRTTLLPVVALAVSVPAFLRTDRAVRGVDARFVDLAGTVGLGRGQVVRQVILPGSLPGVVGAVRLSLAVGWLVLTVGELAAAGTRSGLALAGGGLGPAHTFVTLVMYGVLWLLADVCLRVATSRALAWAG